MSRPGGPSLRYNPALDGIRAFAVLAVIAVHQAFTWLPGGFYGVDSFFVLSGFLITSLLVVEWRGTGTVALGRFWARRARRLLPALYVLVVGIGVVAAVWPAVLAAPHLLENGIATLFYSANWYFVAQHTSYFSVSAQPSPLLHTWSLAIEEQFYLVWPLVVLAVLRLGRTVTPPKRIPVIGRAEVVTVSPSPDDPVARRDRERRLEALFAIASVGALASAVLMGILTPVGSISDRAYYGTDTRAQGLLVGAALAVAFARWGRAHRPARRARTAARATVAATAPQTPTPAMTPALSPAMAPAPASTRPDAPAEPPEVSAPLRRVMAGLAVAGVLGTAALWLFVPESSSLAFHGGFLLAALATAAVIAGATLAPASPVPRLLGLAPLRALGRISYGVYLWYWPVLLVLDGARTHLTGFPLFVLRVVVTVAIAALSYALVESPIRRGALPDWRGLVAAPVAAGLAVAALAAATLVPASATPPVPTTPSVASAGDTAPGTGGSGPVVVPPETTAHPLRVLLLGDSVAGSLGVGLSVEAPRYGVQLVNEGSPGCSLSMDKEIRVLFYTVAPGTPCRSGDPEALIDQWRTWVDEYNPDVVVYLARGELFDQQVGGQWQNIGQDGFDRYLSGRFSQAAQVLSSRGAAVVYLSSPFYQSGDQPSGAPWPEDSPGRATADTAIMSAVVSSSRGVPVSVYDFGSMISPHGAFASTVDGVDMRCGDGVHFTAAAGEWLASRLYPQLAKMGRLHQDFSAPGTWPGPLPAGVPAWWYQLPCR